MLPYRLRPPVYGGKLKQKKKQQPRAAAATAAESSLRQQQSAHSNNKSDNHPSNYTGGGPVQQAIKLDLLQWRPVFCEELLKRQRQLEETRHNSKHDQDKPRHHDPPGGVFGIFQQKVFSHAKMALLHTRTIPPRCHDNAYSQLLYAACLSLLRDAFVGVDDASRYPMMSFQLERAAYAIFCLYALVETSPSSSSVEATTAVDTSSPASLLPLGLATSRQNPKLLHRRTVFKNPQRQRVVRIDSPHYVLLQRVRDECLAQQADCQAKCMQQCFLNRTKQNQDIDDGGAWCCGCGIAIDVVQVLDRLLLPGVLDLVEYTGPCCLEGYVGHEDYYYQQQPPRPSSSPAAKTPILKNRELDAAGRTSTQPNHGLLSALMEKYQTSLNRVLPAAAPEKNHHPQRRNRFTHPAAASCNRTNAAASPLVTLLREQKSLSNVRTWQEIAQDLRTSCTNGLGERTSRGTSTTPHGRERSMMVGNVEEESSKDGVSGATAVPTVHNGRMEEEHGESLPAVPQETTAKRSSYRLAVPSDLPTSLQDGIRKALEGLLEREGDEIMRQSVVTAHPVTIAAVPASWGPNYDGGAYDDDWSSVGGASSVMQYSIASAAMGQGQAALSALLARAGAASAQTTSDKGKTGGLPGTAGIVMPARASTRLPTSLQLTTKSVQKQNAREQFLTLVQESLDKSQEKESDEFSSGQVSDLSSGDEDDDEVSIATSAVGQTALRTLLAAVNSNNKTAASDVVVVPKNNTARRNMPRKTAASQKKQSISTKRKGSSPQHTKRTRRRVPEGESAASGQIVAPPRTSPMNDDDASLFSTSTRGAGKAALDALLAQVGEVPKNPQR